MPSLVVVGAQWGDEGKGKIVDQLAERADIVVRYAGGANAGHTLVVDGQKIVLRLVPSGILHAHTQCLLAQGMVIDPAVLIEEVDTLEHRGTVTTGRLFVSDRAHLILPVHGLVDALREEAASGTKIGTTRRGIGPCYEDKVGRRGVRAGDLLDLDRAAARVRDMLGHWTPIIERLGAKAPKAEEMLESLRLHAERLSPLLVDTSVLLEGELSRGKRVLFEGAQGTLLDVDHGTYPFVTSSTAVAGGACIGAGLGPSRINAVLGITKAYATRVGAGPFPTELFDEAGAKLRNVGAEFGSVTGRPRSTGWLDLPGLRYARRVNGLDALCVTKLDVLTGLSELSVCVAYDTPEGRTRELPVTQLDRARPVYERCPGWDAPLGGCRSLAALPLEARRYLELIEREAGLPIHIVSIGPRREETFVLREPFP